MRLRLDGIEVDCVIGERPDERDRLQRLKVDVDMEIPSTAAETDSLADTVDYAALAEKIRAALVEAKCRMIERAAKVVYDCLPTRDARVVVTTAFTVTVFASPAFFYPSPRHRW